MFFHEEPPYYDEVWAVGRIPGRVLREVLAHASSFREQLYIEWSEKVAPNDDED
ncbi:hypothetical protein BH24GEM3_BH24GEM3_22800 [soil metagenome]